MSDNIQYPIEVEELGPSRRNWSKECESGDVSAFNCPSPCVSPSSISASRKQAKLVLWLPRTPVG